MSDAPQATPSSRAGFALGVLTLVNLLNYTDRYIVAGAMKEMQNKFTLDDTSGGLLATTFMVVYMLASPLGGFLGDRFPRRILIGSAVLIWSLATIASGLATSFLLLVVARAATGIGEAGYGTIAPSFISDLFKPERRSRMLAVFYTAMPLGAAAGFIIGGHFGFPTAFFIGGAPGLVLGVMCLVMAEPPRGGMEEKPVEKVPFLEGLKVLLTNARFWVVTSGLTLMTFSIGGLSNWMPKFLSTERGFEDGEAGLMLGATTVIGGLLGTIVGGVLGDKLEKRKRGGSIWMSGVGLSLAAPMMILAVHSESKWALLGVLLLAQFFIFLNQGPLNAAIVNVVSPGFRAFAFSVSTMTLHLLGDAASPTIIGWISDTSKAHGGPGLATAIQLNALPVLLGGVVLLLGARSFQKHEA